MASWKSYKYDVPNVWHVRTDDAGRARLGAPRPQASAKRRVMAWDGVRRSAQRADRLEADTLPPPPPPARPHVAYKITFPPPSGDKLYPQFPPKNLNNGARRQVPTGTLPWLSWQPSPPPPPTPLFLTDGSISRWNRFRPSAPTRSCSFGKRRRLFPGKHMELKQAFRRIGTESKAT